MKFLLDSVIIIDHLNGRPEASAYLLKVRDQSAISVITRAEVLVPYERTSAGAIHKLLDCFPVLSINIQVADRAAALRREHRWKLPDAFQAALAEEHGLKLATRNTKDFPPEKHRFVIAPY